MPHRIRLDKRIIVYTANIGHYDDYRNLEVIKPCPIRLIYFTDVPNPVAGWEVIQVDKSIIDDKTKLARYYKINSHKVLPPHDISLWIDCRFDIDIKGIIEEINKYTKDDIYQFKHPRSSKYGLFSEAVSISKSKLESEEVIRRQMTKYSDENMPMEHSLYCTGIIIRQNNDKIVKFNEIWWNELRDGSKRDQLSEMYAIWKVGLNVTELFNGTVYHNDFVKKSLKHRHKKVFKNIKNNIYQKESQEDKYNRILRQKRRDVRKKERSEQKKLAKNEFDDKQTKDFLDNGLQI